MIITQAAAHPAFARIAVLGWANEPMRLAGSDVETLKKGLDAASYLPTQRKEMRALFYASDVPHSLIEADEANGSTTPATLGRDALTPGIVRAEAGRIAVPVLVVQSSVDTSPEPNSEPAYFGAAPSVELQMLDGAAHCQNFAGSRALHWTRLDDWIGRTLS